MREQEPDPHNTPSSQVKALLDQAETLVISNPDRARRVLMEASTLAENHGLLIERARALLLEGTCDFFQGDHDRAVEGYRKALKICRTLSSSPLEGRVLNALGMSAQQTGEHGTTMECFLESLRVARKLQHETGVLRATSNIGLMHAELGDHRLALTLNLDVLEGARRMGNEVHQAGALANILVACVQLGDLKAALKHAEEGLLQARRQGLRQYEGVMLAHLALTHLESGLLDAAAEQAGAAAQIAGDLGDQDTLSVALGALGQVHLKHQNPNLAEPIFKAALQAAQKAGLRRNERNIHVSLSDCLEHTNPAAALFHLRQAFRLQQDLHQLESSRRAQMAAAHIKVELIEKEAQLQKQRAEQLLQEKHDLERTRKKLEHRVLHDPLTGLANRAHFQQAISELESSSGAPGIHGILFVDLDHFKRVNDTHGHQAGDELLQQVARRLQGCVRATDLVARLGGDEFTVLLRRLPLASDAVRVARKIHQLMNLPFQLGQPALQVSISCSIGVAVAPEDGLDLQDLQSKADHAMYRAKRAGRNGVFDLKGNALLP